MTIVAGSIGIRAKFVQKLEENSQRTNAGEELEEMLEQQERRCTHPDDFSLDETELNGILSPALRRCFNEAICVNSTAFEDIDADKEQVRAASGNARKKGEEPKKIFVGSKTEAALLKFAKDNGWEDYAKVRSEAEVLQMIPFSSARKAMGIVVKREDGSARLYLKGVGEILRRKCTRRVVVSRLDEEAPKDEEGV